MNVSSFLKRTPIFSISSFKGLICGVPLVNIVRSLICRLPCNHQIRKLLSVLLEIAAVSADAGCRLSTFVVDTIHLTNLSKTLTYWQVRHIELKYKNTFFCDYGLYTNGLKENQQSCWICFEDSTYVILKIRQVWPNLLPKQFLSLTQFIYCALFN